MCECDALFTEFTISPLGGIVQENLPRRGGVYVLRLSEKGTDVDVGKLERKVSELDINYVTSKMWPGICRNMSEVLHAIKSCPVVYIGATGVRQEARANFQTRFEDLFTGKHVIMPSFWLLLLHGWKLDYLHYPCATPKDFEDSLRARYSQVHGRIPPLNRRG